MHKQRKESEIKWTLLKQRSLRFVQHTNNQSQVSDHKLIYYHTDQPFKDLTNKWETNKKQLQNKIDKYCKHQLLY